MAIQGSIIDYDGGGGDRNFTVYVQLAFTGDYVAGGDTLNLTGSGTLPLLNPAGLEVEGFFELPATLAPSVFVENLDGARVQPVVTVQTGGDAPSDAPSLAAFQIQCFTLAGEELSAEAYAAPFTNGTVVLAIKRRRV